MTIKELRNKIVNRLSNTDVSQISLTDLKHYTETVYGIKLLDNILNKEYEKEWGNLPKSLWR